MLGLKELRRVLANIVGRGSILEIQPGGNYGDKLIYDGFRKFLSSTKTTTVEFSSGNFRHDAPKYAFPSSSIYRNMRIISNRFKYISNSIKHTPSAVYIHGGGNFNDIWETGIRCFELVKRFFSCPIIIGPQSVYFDETSPLSVFESTNNDVHFFCREYYSYKILEKVKKRVNNFNLHIDNDTALYLEPEDLPTNNITRQYSLIAFRGDKDSASPTIETEVETPIKAEDISLNSKSYASFVKKAAAASRIYTDRLHVMIIGYILGKHVRAFDTGYHKNRGVYEYSFGETSDISFKQII